MRALVLVLFLASCGEGDDYPVMPNTAGGGVVTGVHVTPFDGGIPPLDVALPSIDARVDAPPPADAE